VLDTTTASLYNLMCDQICTYNTKEAIEQLVKYYSFETVEYMIVLKVQAIYSDKHHFLRV
jgi:hypothetical protein